MEQQKSSKLLDNYDWKEKTKAIWKRLAGDMAAATITATLVAPTVTVFDRTIVEKASLNRPLLRGLRMHAFSILSRPGRFFVTKPFGIVWTLYAATYCVANGADTIAREFHPSAAGAITFASTLLVNVPLGVWKDIRFAQIFGNSLATTSASSSTMPISETKTNSPRLLNNLTTTTRTGSFFLKAATTAFLARDAITIFGSFTLAPSLSATIPDSILGIPTNHHSKEAITQMTVPISTQLLATPMHLLGLDLYNRPYAVLWSDRISRTRRDLLSATFVRCVRIFPAFGLGCLLNVELRSSSYALLGV